MNSVHKWLLRQYFKNCYISLIFLTTTDISNHKLPWRGIAFSRYCRPFQKEPCPNLPNVTDLQPQWMFKVLFYNVLGSEAVWSMMMCILKCFHF